MSNPANGVRRNPLMAVVGVNPAKARPMKKKSKAKAKAKRRVSQAVAKQRLANLRKAQAALAAKKASAPTTKRRAKRTKRKGRARTTAVAVVTGAKGLKATRLNPRRRSAPRGWLRNPLSATGGIFADFKALPGELSNLFTPQGLMWAGAGAATSAVLGAVIAPTVAKFVPVSSPLVGRFVNGGTYLVAGAVPALALRDPAKRRKFLAGAVGLALSEVIAPGWSSDALRKVPVVGSWIPTPVVSKKLNDDMLVDMPSEGGLSGWAKRPIGGFFAKAATRPATAVRRASSVKALASDLAALAGLDPLNDRPGALAGFDPLRDRPGALAGFDPMNDRPGALAGLPLGAL